MDNTSYYKSPVGMLLIKDSGEMITLLRKAEGALKQVFNSNISLKLSLQLDAYFAGKRQSFNINYELKGSTFQESVWQALATIPYGETRSYKDIAKQIGKPEASRAVGMACNKNPLLLLIPCHRVVSSSGKLTGYAGGLSMKEELLRVEEAQK